MNIPEDDVHAMMRGLFAVAELIEDSRGVDGLHLNGDLAPWSSLRTGGREEEWLLAFDEGLEIAERIAGLR